MERDREREIERERENQSLNHLSVSQWVCSAIHASQQLTSHRFPIFETSATALCGTIGYVVGIISIN